MSYNNTKEHIESLCEQVDGTLDVIVNDVLSKSVQHKLNYVINGVEIIYNDEGDYSDAYLNRIYRETSQALDVCRDLINRCGNGLAEMSKTLDKIEIILNNDMLKRG